jgi:hypothetical protein
MLLRLTTARLTESTPLVSYTELSPSEGRLRPLELPGGDRDAPAVSAQRVRERYERVLGVCVVVRGLPSVQERSMGEVGHLVASGSVD